MMKIILVFSQKKIYFFFMLVYNNFRARMGCSIQHLDAL